MHVSCACVCCVVVGDDDDNGDKILLVFPNGKGSIFNMEDLEYDFCFCIWSYVFY